MSGSLMVVPSAFYRQGAAKVLHHVASSPFLPCNSWRSTVPLASRPRCIQTQSQHGQHGQHGPPIEDIRNIGIIAHVDAGKTTTTERMLFYSGLTRYLGNVDHGTCQTDYLEEEKKRGITIQSAAITLHWPPVDSCPDGTSPKTINLIDTPGHGDFRFEVDRCIPILDGAICIIDAVKGVEAHTERVWNSAQEYRIPRLIFVNKFDRDGASFKKSVTDIASRLNVWPLVCQLPLWDRDANFVGVVDVIRRVAMKWPTVNKMSTLPSSTLKADPNLWAEIEKARSRLIEKLCDHDNALLEEFMELGDDMPAESIKRSIRKVIMDGSGAMAPVFVGASLRNLGVQPLLDAVIDYLPNPGEAHSPEATLGGKKIELETVISSDVTNPSAKNNRSHHHPQVGAVGVVFKVVNDGVITTKGQGMLSFVRVYHGSLHKNSQLWNANLGAFERATTIKQISAGHVVDIPDIAAGQIGAMTGLRKARTGDTLLILPSHSHGSPAASMKQLKVRPPEIAPPVAFLSVEPYTPTGRQLLEHSLDEMHREDPSLRFNWDKRTEAFVISGMGEMHLEIAINRLKKAKVDGLWSDIQVEYKECLDASLSKRYRCIYDKDIAGKKGEARCIATIQPIEEVNPEVVHSYSRERDGNIVYFDFKRERGEDLPFDPDTICDLLYNGALSAISRGPRRGSPMHGLAVTLTFNHKTCYFGPDTEGHIVQAARLAVKLALDNAHEQKLISILEPVMATSILVPEANVGTVNHDISSARGGQVLEIRDTNTGGVSTDSLIDLSKVYIPPDPYEMTQSLRGPKIGVTRWIEIIAHMPLKETLNYESRLEEMTGGMVSWSMEFERFMKVKGHRAKDL